MRKLFIILVLVLTTVLSYGNPFAGRTKHKPIKRLHRKEVRQIINGKNMYVREKGKVYRNYRPQWGTVKKPRYHISKK